MNSKSVKYSKQNRLTAIKYYFAKQGKRLTNLSKANIKKLDEIIEKYNINIDECINENVELFRIQQRKDDIDTFIKNYKNIKNRIQQKKVWDRLNQDQKDLCYDYLIKLDDVNNKKNYNDNIEMSKKIEEKFTADNKKVERINDITLNINGINLINGWYYEELTKEKINEIKNQFRQQNYINQYDYQKVKHLIDAFNQENFKRDLELIKIRLNIKKVKKSTLKKKKQRKIKKIVYISDDEN